jgi:hypothetical protein
MKAGPKTGALKLQWVAYNRTELSTRGEDFAVLPLFSKAFDFITLSLPALYFPVI